MSCRLRSSGWSHLVHYNRVYQTQFLINNTLLLDDLPALSGLGFSSTMSNSLTLVKIILWWSPHCTEACQFQCFRAWSMEKTICIFFAFVDFHMFHEYFRLTQDFLVHHGCHFDWTVHSFCRIQMLLTNGIVTMVEDSDTDSLSTAWVPDKLYTQLMLMLSFRKWKEFEVFHELLRMVPSLEAHLMAFAEDKMIHTAKLVCPIYLRWSIMYPEVHSHGSGRCIRK